MALKLTDMLRPQNKKIEWNDKIKLLEDKNVGVGDVKEKFN